VISTVITAIAGAALFWHLAVGATTVFTAGLLFKGIAVTLLSGVGGGLQMSIILDEILRDKSHPGFHMLTIVGAIGGFLFGSWAGAVLGWLIAPTACALSALCFCGCHTEEPTSNQPEKSEF
jgi:presenilin-like A22 family membrane protease